MKTVGDQEIYVSADPSELKTRPPFSNLLPIRPQTLQQIAEDMAANGYDHSKPVNVWRAENVIVDGHTRQRAAIKAGCEVLVCFHDFKDEDEAMEYAIYSQARRRNLSDAELIRLVAVLDERQQRGGDRGNQYTGGKRTGVSLPDFKTSKRSAELLGTNYKKIERARRVLDYADATGDTEEKEKIEAGTMSINMGADSVRVKAHRERGEDTQKKEKFGKDAIVGSNGLPSVAHQCAADAIACLKRIPKSDHLRNRGFQIVAKWIRDNKGT